MDLAITLDLSKIEDWIEEASENLRTVVASLFKNISELEYNVETLLTGVNQKQKVINDEDYLTYYNNAQHNLNELKKELLELNVSMKQDIH